MVEKQLKIKNEELRILEINLITNILNFFRHNAWRIRRAFFVEILNYSLG